MDERDDDARHKPLFESLLDRVTLRHEGVGYRAFTRAYDVETAPAGLDALLGPPDEAETAAVDEAVRQYLAARTEALDELTEALHERLSAVAPIETRCDTAVAILIDQSGSMKGERMAHAAAAALNLRAALEGLGATTEILGFTTAAWQGGQARRDWIAAGRPRMPGRLNGLLHILYRTGVQRGFELPREDLRRLLRPTLAKENIDGEALEWAAARLLARPENLKVLLVLSDGAPVDDATLYHNTQAYLSDHLAEAALAIRQAGAIELGAVGIGYPVHDTYPWNREAERLEEIAPALLDLAETILTHEWSL